MSFGRLQRQFSVRQNNPGKSCIHKGGETYVSNGLKLKCCAGAGGDCKLREIDYLTMHLVQKCDQVDELQAKVSQLEKLVGNKTVNVVVAQGVEIVELSWKSNGVINLYQAAFQQLQQAKSTDERNRLLRLATSPDLADRLSFQREVIVGVEEVLPQLPEEMRTQLDSHLDTLCEQTNQVAIQNGIQVVESL